jgi:L-ascorbate metabolism protein UlaG (beta-lactamase superfamily)
MATEEAIWISTFQRMDALSGLKALCSFGQTCQTGYKILQNYIEVFRSNVLKNFKWWHTDNYDSTHIGLLKIRGQFRNHKDDEHPTLAFARTLAVTFLPTRGIFAKPSKLSTETIYQPARCPLPDGKTSHLTVLWVGHASVFFQYKRNEETPLQKFLIDPNCADKIDLVGPLHYQRITPPGILPDRMGTVSATLVTHNHDDHCNEQTISELWKHNSEMRLLTPEGTGTRLATQNSAQGKSIDHSWWEKTVLYYEDQPIVEFTSIPAHHASGGRNAGNQTEGWCGWKLNFFLSNEQSYTVYHMGDTSCHINTKVKGTMKQHVEHHRRMFSEIKKELGHIDLALVPIDPPYGEEDMHLNSLQGVDLFEREISDVCTIIPIHWGTWCWGKGCDPTNMTSSLTKFQEAAKGTSLQEKILPLKVGEELLLI